MGNFNLSIPTLGNTFTDYRNQILGDSFNWSWIRPMSQVRYLVIHHSAGPPTQTPDDIAAYHVRSRGWGGVGYHFIISANGKVYYVGDLTTARANVLDMNQLVVGICLIGNFVDEALPTDDQIRSAHLLCAHLLFHTPELSGVDGWEDVVGHQQLGATACPGTDWQTWRQKIIAVPGGTEGGTQRIQDITKLYQIVLGRDPDQGGLQQYANGPLTIDEIRKDMAESQEHQQILNKAKGFKQAQTLAAEAVQLIDQAHAKTENITRL